MEADRICSGIPVKHSVSPGLSENAASIEPPTPTQAVISLADAKL